jgi:hypothetical protein
VIGAAQMKCGCINLKLVRQLFATVDTDHDNMINESEFNALVARISSVHTLSTMGMNLKSLLQLDDDSQAESKLIWDA